MKENCEVAALTGFGKEKSVFDQWLKLWLSLGKKLIYMPDWMRKIILEDVRTSIDNRVSTMEMIQRHLTAKGAV